MPSTIDPSTIDPTKPTTGTALTADVRANEAATQDNFTAAKSDIDRLDVLVNDGELLSYDGVVYVKIPVGTDGQVLTARPGNGAGGKLVYETLTDPVLDHGALTGLGDDDHTQYHTDQRGDARYYTQAHSDTNFAPMSHVGATGAAHGDVSVSAAGFMLAADKIKLDGMPADAVEEAPSDGQQYARKDAAWSIVVATGGRELQSEGVPLANQTLSAINIAGNGISIAENVPQDRYDIVANNAQVANVGGQAEIWRDTTGTDPTVVNLRTLWSGDGSVSFGQLADTLDVRATGVGGGEANRLENIGGAVEVGLTVPNGVNLQVRTFAAGTFEIAADVIQVIPGTYDAGGSAADVQVNLDTHTANTAIHFPLSSLPGGGLVQDVSALAVGAGAGVTVAADSVAVTGAPVTLGAMWVHDGATQIPLAVGTEEQILSVVAGAPTWKEQPVAPPSGAALSYDFDASIVASDPGTGNLRLNNADLTLATEVYADELTRNGNSADPPWSILTTDDYVSIYERQQGDRGGWYQLTGPPVDNSGWWTIPVVYIPGEAIPLRDGRELLVGLAVNPARFGAEALAGDGLTALGDEIKLDISDIADLAGPEGNPEFATMAVADVGAGGDGGTRQWTFNQLNTLAGVAIWYYDVGKQRFSSPQAIAPAVGAATLYLDGASTAGFILQDAASVSGTRAMRMDVASNEIVFSSIADGAYTPGSGYAGFDSPVISAAASLSTGVWDFRQGVPSISNSAGFLIANSVTSQIAEVGYTHTETVHDIETDGQTFSPTIAGNGYYRVIDTGVGSRTITINRPSAGTGDVVITIELTVGAVSLDAAPDISVGTDAPDESRMLTLNRTASLITAAWLTN